MLDLTNAIEEINYYKGSEKKKTLVYEGKKYLVKFPDPIREKGKNISYLDCVDLMCKIQCLQFINTMKEKK